MKNLLLVGGIAILAALNSFAQAPVLLRAQLQSGDALDYEFEGHFEFLPSATRGVTVSKPTYCEYDFGAIIHLQVDRQSLSSGVSGTITYKEAKLLQMHCDALSESKAKQRLREIEQSPLPFTVSAQGEIGFPFPHDQELDFMGDFRVLTSSTIDLLQTVFHARPVRVGESWKPVGNFVYWREAVESGMLLSAASMRYQRDLTLAGDNCSLVTLKYVFAPDNTPPSSFVPRGTADRIEVKNRVSGALHVSALLDRTTGHLAWVQRRRQLTNHMSFGRDGAGYDLPAVDFRVTEEGIARLLQNERLLEWTTALRHFELTGGDEVSARAIGAASLMVRLAHDTQAAHPLRPEVDKVDPAPPGYRRFEKELCSENWTCSWISVALPESAQLADDTPERTVYLVKKGSTVTSVALGPTQTKPVRGLTDQEELRKTALAYLAGNLWIPSRPGTPTSLSQ
ncbi:MAG TPA: hypothetical protein VEW69_05015, partial [Alphaproteobacteria bacterium]|nr:hypothetical protein [Alphaproteobacteria bacterium]